MNIYIPIADVTLTDGQTYDGQLPVWATRPLMVKVTTGTNEPVNITVRNSGSPVKTVTLPYQQYGMEIDLSLLPLCLSAPTVTNRRVRLGLCSKNYCFGLTTRPTI